MYFLKNKNISKKLMFGFSVIISFSLIIGLNSVYNIIKISNQTKNMYSSPYVGVKSILTIKNNIINIHSLMQNISMSDDKEQIASLSQEIKALQLNVFEEFKLCEKSGLASYEDILALKTKFIDWIPILNEVSNLSLADMGEVAGNITNEIGKQHVESLNESIETMTADAQISAELFLNSANQSSSFSLAVNLLLLLVMTLSSVWIAAITARMIVPPLKAIEKVTKSLAEGNLDMVMESYNRDEIGTLSDSLSETIAILNWYISDIKRLLTSMSHGNMQVAAEGDYKGSFLPIKLALNEIIASLNDMLFQIHTAADVTASSSKIVSSEASMLSESVTGQAQSLKELSIQIEQISKQAEHNSMNAEEASQLFQKVKEAASVGNENMGHMLFSMSEITESSHKIEKVVSIMDNIAMRTELLALNATVEAVKAGENGRGFGVVAREVRSLSAQSADAARETRQLVEDSLSKILLGESAAGMTADSIQKIIDVIGDAVRLIDEIYHSSSVQSELVESAVPIVNGILDLVRQAEDIARRSANESGSLSQQAVVLKEMLEHFRLRNSAL